MTWLDADGDRVWPMLVRTGKGELVDGWKRIRGTWNSRCLVRGNFRANAQYFQELAFEVCECNEARGAHECHPPKP